MAKFAAGFLIYRSLNNQVQYLFLRASYGNFHWSPPKGHMDEGEDEFTTALRETEEETGYIESDLKISNESMILKYNVGQNQKTVIYWLAQLRNPNKNPVLSAEHTEYNWLPKEQAKEKAKYKEFKELIDFFDAKINK